MKDSADAEPAHQRTVAVSQHTMQSSALMVGMAGAGDMGTEEHVSCTVKRAQAAGGGCSGGKGRVASLKPHGIVSFARRAVIFCLFVFQWRRATL